MKFIELPIPVDEHTPKGFKLIVAYAKGSKVFIPIAEMPENEEFHNCDWEGCGSLNHVASFDAISKYTEDVENTKARNFVNDLKNITTLNPETWATEVECLMSKHNI